MFHTQLSIPTPFGFRYSVVSDFEQASAAAPDTEAEPAVEVMVVDNSALRHLEILENISSETGAWLMLASVAYIRI